MGTVEINYDVSTQMKNGFPKIRKLGAVSPNGEASPFVFRGEAYRLELEDPTRGTDASHPVCALIRRRETGEVISRLAQGCYYQSFYQENDTAYVIGVRSDPGCLPGHVFEIYESQDLIHWEKRTLLERPGWLFYNSSLTRGPEGYVLCMEAGSPKEAVGPYPFTMFFAVSPDMIHWTFLPDEMAFSRERYMGGPWMHYSEGWYYLITVTELPCQRYTNYIYRTQDFHTWYVGLYNPLLMPDEEDRKLSPLAADLTQRHLQEIQHGFISSNSDIDMCDWQGKTLITYIAGNQLGFYYLAEAEYDGTMAQFLANNFE